MKLGTCHICKLQVVEVMEWSITATNTQNDPPLTILQTFELCNFCFMKWWNGEIKLDYTRKEELV